MWMIRWHRDDGPWLFYVGYYYYTPEKAARDTYTPNSWYTHSQHETIEEAEMKVHYLNGGKFYPDGREIALKPKEGGTKEVLIGKKDTRYATASDGKDIDESAFNKCQSALHDLSQAPDELTKREWFAGMALSSIGSRLIFDEKGIEGGTEIAIRIADAILMNLEKGRQWVGGKS